MHRCMLPAAKRRERTSAEAESTGKAGERTNKARLYIAYHVDHSRGKRPDKALKRSSAHHRCSSKILLCTKPRTGPGAQFTVSK